MWKTLIQRIPKWPDGQLDRSPPIVLQPYTTAPDFGWRRYAGWLLMAALMFFCLVYGFYYALTTPFLLTQFMAPLALLAGITIWALPDMKTAPTRTLEVLFFAFFVMAIIWPNYLAIALPGLPWITSVRLVGFPLVFVLAVSVSVSAEFRARTWASLTAIPRLWVFIAGFVGVQFLSIGLSDKPFESLNAVVSLQISWTAIFFAACYAFLRPGSVQTWAITLWTCAILVCLIGLWEQRLGRVPWAGHIPGFLAVGDEFVQRILAGARRLGSGKYRVQSVQSTSLGLAEFLALTTPFIIHFMAGRFSLWIKVAAGASLPLILYTILATDARLGAVGFFMSVLLYLLIWSFIQWRHVKGSLLGPAVFLAYPVIFCAFMAATFAIQRLRLIVWGGGSTTYSNQARIDQLHSGIPKILNRPVGYGAGQGADELGYVNLAGTMTIDNYYLLIALEYGILGFILYYGAIALVIYHAAKHSLLREPENREHTFLIPVAISLSVFFIIKSIFSQMGNHTLQFMMMGMAAALIFRMKHGDAAGLPPSRSYMPPERQGIVQPTSLSTRRAK